ncbi:hypothetical protein [Streptomyces sp. NPDC059272]|uniref:hypothetical protein n=1 Tax=Streptomyces sp. NPDC059272 TaxID=3346800 RepID=UPI00367F4EA7
MAPKHPFPAAVDDALAVYRAVLDDGISSFQFFDPPSDSLVMGMPTSAAARFPTSRRLPGLRRRASTAGIPGTTSSMVHPSTS